MTTEKAVLLSIRPRFADAILNGEKPYEYRRVAPVLDTPYTAIIYATGDVGAVIGTATVPHVIRGSTASIVERADTRPSSPERIEQYLRGGRSPGALRMADPQRVDPVPLRRVTDGDPPQNFVYLPRRDVDSVLTALSNHA